MRYIYILHTSGNIVNMMEITTIPQDHPTFERESDGYGVKKQGISGLPGTNSDLRMSKQGGHAAYFLW